MKFCIYNNPGSSNMWLAQSSAVLCPMTSAAVISYLQGLSSSDWTPTPGFRTVSLATRPPELLVWDSPVTGDPHDLPLILHRLHPLPIIPSLALIPTLAQPTTTATSNALCYPLPNNINPAAHFNLNPISVSKGEQRSFSTTTNKLTLTSSSSTINLCAAHVIETTSFSCVFTTVLGSALKSNIILSLEFFWYFYWVSSID